MPIHKHVASYLNDHLAGSTTAIEMVEHLRRACAGRPDIAGLLGDLLAEITADRSVLQELMAGLGIAESAPRKASAWLAEKFAQLKLRMEDAPGGSLHLLEGIEAVLLGIEGKRRLWLALAAAEKVDAKLQGLDYPTLIRRAEQQRDDVERIRISAATELYSAVASR